MTESRSIFANSIVISRQAEAWVASTTRQWTSTPELSYNAQVLTTFRVLLQPVISRAPARHCVTPSLITKVDRPVVLE